MEKEKLTEKEKCLQRSSGKKNYKTVDYFKIYAIIWKCK